MQKMARALAARILATPHTSPSLSALFQSAGVQASEPAGVRAVCAVLTAIGEVGDARAARPLWLFARQLLRRCLHLTFPLLPTRPPKCTHRVRSPQGLLADSFPHVDLYQRAALIAQPLHTNLPLQTRLGKSTREA